MNLFSKKTLTVITMMLATLLAACGSAADAGATPNPTDAISAINTIVMQTVNAQYASASTPTDVPTDIPSLTDPPLLAFVSPTPFIDATLNTTSSSACDNSAYISDVTIPDNTAVEAGQAFVKTWMLQNTGSCAWDANYALTFISGDEMGGANTSLAASVAPGQDVDVSVDLTAPAATGQDTGYWQLANDTGATFGVSVYALIDVIEDVTATPTVTPETPTISPTTTPTVISTTVSTNVPTTAPTAIPTTASTVAPTTTPTNVPTTTPTVIPTAIPSTTPTIIPTATPTDDPTAAS